MIKFAVGSILFITTVVINTAYAGCDHGKLNSCCMLISDNQTMPELVLNASSTSKLYRSEKYGSAANPISLWVGGKNTPYERIAKDIENLLLCEGLAIEPHNSDGSYDIISAIADKRKDAKFGIVQSDILQDRRNNEEQIRKSIRIVADLHQEEVHLISNSDIKTWAQLAGKKVYIGSDGSGTRFTAKKIIDSKAKLDPAMILIDSSDNLMKELKDGTLDAMFAVIGAPADNIAQLLSLSNDFNLISTVADTDTLVQEYQKGIIPAGSYPGVEVDVETYVVKAKLITYRWKPGGVLCHFTKIIYDSLNGAHEGLMGLVAEDLADPNWLKVDLDNTKKMGGITPRSDCL